MDNPYYGWSPLVTRTPWTLPRGERVAVCVIVSVETLEWLPPAEAHVPPSAVRWGPYPSVFDVHEASLHEYGNRVGIFRVLAALREFDIPVTVAIDAKSCETAAIVQACEQAGAEFIAHGACFSRMITSRMTVEQEREYIRSALDAIEAGVSTRPRGWLGPDYGESAHTIDLLAELGVDYVCDWPNDEQPYWMTARTGRVVSLPVSLELDDVFSLRERSLPVDRWSRTITETFDRLRQEGATNPRMVVLNLHPYVCGQPFRIRHLSAALAHLREAEDDVWFAQAGDIVDWFVTPSPK
jgi:peptidoglycan/xylan/chitin deacetylase (PgdA/CDA1 family)